MVSLNEVRTGLKNALAAIPGIRAYAVQPPNPQPPAVYVGGLTSESVYQADFSGSVHWFFEVGVFVSPADLGRAQTQLDTYLDPNGSSSIVAAVKADETLGGVVDFARVVGVGESPRLVDSAGSQLLYASVRVEVRGV